MDDQSLSLDEVLGYLRSNEDFSLGPMAAIRAQTEAIGDPSLPRPPQVAVLEWLQDAYEMWAENFPIEEPLAADIRKLLPAAAALAITDEEFFLPGSHPIHQLLDAIHSSAIGWQPALGRAAQSLEQLVAQAIKDTDGWFRGNDKDLADICQKLTTKAEKDQDRTQRMTQRLVDREVGQIRSASARWKSAEMINRALEHHKATIEIGEFLRGPWYESAQLVLLKFGADSPEWAQMSNVTETLLSSLLIDHQGSEEGRQKLFELVTKIPKDLKRWLLSLHMDTQAVNDAIGQIEKTHLRLLRQQDIELETIEPLHMEGMLENRTEGVQLETIESLQIGQWFLIDEGKGAALRTQLILKLMQEQQLQFANKAGMKALELSFQDFCILLARGKVSPLRSGQSFSLCLAVSAGIESLAQLDNLVKQEMPELAAQARLEARKAENDREEQHRQTQIQREKAQLIALEQRELQDALQDEGEQRALEEALKVQREQELELRREQEKRELEETQKAEQKQRELDENNRAEQEQRELEQAQKFEKEQLEREQTQKDEQQRRETEQAQIAEQQQRELEEAQALEPEQPQQDPPADPQQTLEAEAATLATQTPLLEDNNGGGKPAGGLLAPYEGFLGQAQEFLAVPEDLPDLDDDFPAPTDGFLGQPQQAPPDTSAQTPTSARAEPDQAAARSEDIHLPMGTWLGFHDGEAPLMAKLAVHDREQDSYIFVNREGIKMRSLNKEELLGLIESNQVDILEARTNFRDAVIQAKKENN